MPSHQPIVLVGNALSLMVAATRFAKQGIDVVIANSGRNWGGHFTTMDCNGARFDPGMVLHEFTSFKTVQPFQDVRTYDPAVRNDCGRFCDAVRQCVAAYQELRDIAAPSMYVDGAVYDDVLIANALSSVPQFTFRDAIESELRQIVTGNLASQLHASQKYANEEFTFLDYRATSLVNHGETFHETLIEPYCKKVLNVGTEDVVALYHRAAWLPLFYPETILSYLQGTPRTLPPTTFTYPHHEHVGDFATKLKSEIDNSDRITIISEPLQKVSAFDSGDYELEFSNRPRVSTKRLAWSNSLGDLLRAVGHPQASATYQKCSIALAFLRTPTNALKRDFSVLNVVDAEIGMYRITNQTGCAGVRSSTVDLVAEVNPDFAAKMLTERTPAGVTNLVAGDLVKLGIVDDPTVVEYLDTKLLNSALMLPSQVNRRAFLKEAQAANYAVPDVALLGPASGFFSSSFNDQVVQGIKLVSVWGNSQ